MATWCRPGQLESPDGHDIPLDGVFVFEDLDPSSDGGHRLPGDQRSAPGFVVVGSISDEQSNWTVPYLTPSAATPCARRMASPAPSPSR